jgi:tetratricopeptide (TPR) repeat protein
MKKKIIRYYQTLTFLIVIFLGQNLSVQTLKAETLNERQVVDLYAQAKDLFRQANELAATSPEQAEDLYRKAAMRYERIIREGGVQNGKLYYNLGNVYFRVKDLGRAILNYRRAEQYIPNDPNLKQNLDYAREKRFDQIEERQETKVLKTLFFWHYDLSTKKRVIIFSLFFILLWAFAAMRIFAQNSYLRWGIALSFIFSLLLVGSLVAEELSLRKTRPGVIISHEVVARKGNSETYEPSFKEPLHSGTEFTLIEDRGNWYQIELADARTCWIHSKDVALVR